jgi:predicted transport protein
LLCIAGDFTKYDEYAVQQINRNIELLRYRLFSEEYLMLELVNSLQEKKSVKTIPNGTNGIKSEGHKHNLNQAGKELTELYEAVREYLFSLGDEVQEKELKWYVAFKKLKNFLCVQVNAGKGDPCLVLWLKVVASEVELEEGFSRDVTNVGHLGTGSLELRLRDMKDLEKAKPFIEMSYQNS